MSERSRTALKKAGTILFASFVVLVVLIAAGLAYTWWAGQQPVPTQETVEETDSLPRPTQVEPRTLPPDAPVSLSSQLLTTPVLPGENASLTVKTNPLAECEITVTYGDLGDETAQSTDSGLRPRAADPFGIVTWTWTVESNRPLGDWPVEVTCANEAKSGYLRLTLTIGQDETQS